MLASKSLEWADLTCRMIATMERYRLRTETSIDVEILPDGCEVAIPGDLCRRIEEKHWPVGAVVRRAVREWLEQVGRSPTLGEIDDAWEKVSSLGVEIQRSTLPSRPVQGWAEIERLEDIAAAERLRREAAAEAHRWRSG